MMHIERTDGTITPAVGIAYSREECIAFARQQAEIAGSRARIARQVEVSDTEDRQRAAMYERIARLLAA